MQTAEAGAGWQEDIFRILKAQGAKHIVYVPDAGHSTAIAMAEADSEIHSVVLTTEEEGVGYLAGAWLGGERGAMQLQSSGVGNCLNTLSLQVCGGFPLLMVVTMRGDWAEFNPWQNPMGAGDGKSARPDGRDDMAGRRARGRRSLAQRRGDHGVQRRFRLRTDSGTALDRRKAMVRSALDRREAVSRLLTGRQDLLVVTGLGSASYDVMAVGDHDNNYYLWGAMGSAAMVGLGLARARPNHSVLVITGDGEMLMGLGALATIALQEPANLTIAVLDNGHFGETGMQRSHTSQGIDLDRVAATCGFGWTREIRDIEGVDELRTRIVTREGVKFATIKIKADNPLRVLPPRDSVAIKNRFSASLGLATI